MAPTCATPGPDVAALGRHALALSRVPDVARVETAAGVYVGGRQVAGPLPALARYATDRRGRGPGSMPTVEGYSGPGERVAKAVRAVPAPFPTLVGGQSAEFVDVKSRSADGCRSRWR